MIDWRRPIEEVIEKTKESNVVKIEDLIPWFDEKMKIELFKDEICRSLKDYNEEISDFKKKMDAYGKNTEQIKNSLKDLRNEYVYVKADRVCEHCRARLFTSEFYCFLCGHTFHRVSPSLFLIL